MQHISSLLIHGLKDPATIAHRSLKTPIFETASFDFASAEDVEKSFNGTADTYAYSRVTNPTVEELQNRLKIFSGAGQVLCVASGMAAISNVFTTLCASGDNIISSHYLFGNTSSFFSKTLHAFGVETRFTDMEDLQAVENSIDSNTRAIFLELPTNPQLIFFDIEGIARIAKSKNVTLVVDNTVLTPYLFQCRNYDIDIEIFSNTKFVSGGATSIGGSILVYESDKWAHNPKLKADYGKFGSDAFYKRLHKEIYRNIGACLSPNNAYLQLLGLETIAVRIDRIIENTIETAKYLQAHPKVKVVSYAALPEDPGHLLATRLTGGRPGCLIGVELKDKKESFLFMNSLKMIRRGTNFCDNKSMIIHPASTIYWDFSKEEKERMRISEGLLRLSVGLEHIDDIIADLEQALKHI